MAADKWRVSASYRQRWSRVGIRLEFKSLWNRSQVRASPARRSPRVLRGSAPTHVSALGGFI